MEMNVPTPTSPASSSYVPAEGQNWQMSKGDVQINTADSPQELKLVVSQNK